MKPLTSEQTIAWLESKRRVDDRALSVPVLQRLVQELGRLRASEGRPLRILELGAGTGTMFERLRLRGLLRGGDCYHLTDLDGELLDFARNRLLAADGNTEQGELLLVPPDGQAEPGEEIRLSFASVDLLELPEPASGQAWDLIIAHALLDLLDPGLAVRRLLEALAPGGLLYASLVYDGLTAFEPPVRRRLDERVMEAYDASMEAPGRAGPHAGRRLISEVLSQKADLLESGRSTWSVPADPLGKPSAEEQSFLQTMLLFFEDALVPGTKVSAEEIEHWLAERRRLLAEGQTRMVALHRDLLAQRRKPDPGSV